MKGIIVKAGRPSALMVLLAGVMLAPIAQADQPAPLLKLDGQVRELARDARADRDSTARERAGLDLRAGDRLLVDVHVDGDLDRARKRLTSLGMQITALGPTEPQKLVEGWLPLERATEVAELDETQAVLPVVGGGTNTGSVLSQGDAAHRGPQARAFGPSGAGVKVGVISDTIDKVGTGVAGSQASGNLPGDVQVLSEPVSGTDEGRAMAEIIYDTAPAAPTFLFSSGVVGPAAKATSIANLAAAGSKVIADDTFWLNEPFFQDGQVAQAVDAAKATGVAYLVSAGNRARQSWEGDFVPATGSYSDFDTSGGEDTEQTVVTLPNGGNITLVLQWAEPWGAASTDLDIELYNITSGNTLWASSNTNNIVTGIPMESVTITNAGSAAQVGLKIKRNGGTGTPPMKYIIRSNLGAFTISEFATNSGTIDPDAASASGALTVGAVRWSQSGLNSPESFSSRGPATRRFDAVGTPLGSPDVRQKPELAGADGVATSVSGFGFFLGTSASAPSVAGIAALLRSADPAMSVDELYSVLKDPFNTIDCLAVGNPDLDCGYGFVLADGATGQVLDTTPPTVTGITGPSQPDGSNGWFRTPIDLSWATVDDLSSIQSNSGCGSTTITGDGQFTLSCSASSRGGSASGSLTVKHDGTPPATPSIEGIAAKRYRGKTLPARSKILCKSSDPTSGLEGCKIAGYSTESGRHKLTGTATNGAGATAADSLTYTLAATISGLKARPVKLSSALGPGIPLTVKVADARTRITATATVSGSKGSKTVTAGKLSKTVKRGKARLRLKLNARGKKALRRSGKTKLKLTVTGKSGRATTTLRRSLSLR